MNLPVLAESRPDWGTRRSRKNAVLLAVLLLHGLLLLSWRSAVAPRPEPPRAEAPTLLWLRVAPLPLPSPRQPPPADTPAPTVGLATPPSLTRAARATTVAPERRPPRSDTSERASTAPTTAATTAPSTLPTDAAAPTTLSAIAAEPVSPDRAASAPQTAPPSLLDNEATRQAIRQIGRQPLLSERAADATDLPLRHRDTRLAEAAAQAGKGDCLKGQYLGGGAGLLSVPFLALAVARGQCAK